MLLSGFVYKYRCGGWNAIYFGKTKCHFKVRICEYLAFHISLWRLTTKVKIDSKKLRAIQERHLCCNYSPSFEGFSILTRESNHFTLKLMESLLIARDKPALNKVDSWLPIVAQFNNFITWCSSLSHCVCTIVVFSVFNIRIFSKTECISTWYHFRCFISSCFWKLAVNK